MSNSLIDFTKRRDQISGLVLDDSAIVIASSSTKSRNSDADFPFRQDSNFFYLSGFNEPDSVILIRPSSKGAKYIIFCRDRDPLREQWDGFREGLEGAVKNIGADEAYSISSLNELMPGFLEETQNIYF